MFDWGSAGGMASSLLQTAGNMVMTRETNAANKEMAGRQMEFQERMSNTAHQREARDLWLAGLNPTLSTDGAGASSPSGASANMVAPQIELPDMMAYGISLKQLAQADKKLQLEEDMTVAQIAKIVDEKELLKMKKILSQKGMIKAEVEGEAAGMLREVFKYLRNSVRKQHSPGVSPITNPENIPLVP